MSSTDTSHSVAEMAAQLLKKYKNLVIGKYQEQADSYRLHQLMANNRFAQQIDGLHKEHCFKYDADPNVFTAVMDTIDLDLIYSNVDKNEESEQDYEKALVKELLRYFKEDFFTWTNQPNCAQCGNNTNQQFKGADRPTPEEQRDDRLLSVVEVYECTNCQTKTRFPRYNSPYMLLKTKTGRCGEWANMFLFILKSFGITSRYIWNREDHVWSEYYNDKEKRWIHLDSCENSYDQPFIYSKNWNKKMSYCFAFGSDAVADVSAKYIVVKDNALPRTEIEETDLCFLLFELTKSLRNGLNAEELYKLGCRDQLEFLEREGEEVVSKTSTAPLGRVSGNAEWKKSRGEGGQ
ncbi:hypothetical protein ACO0QE_002480 [Hanseniaspora vineae]